MKSSGRRTVRSLGQGTQARQVAGQDICRLEIRAQQTTQGTVPSSPDNPHLKGRAAAALGLGGRGRSVGGGRSINDLTNLQSAESKAWRWVVGARDPELQSAAATHDIGLWGHGTQNSRPARTTAMRCYRTMQSKAASRPSTLTAASALAGSTTVAPLPPLPPAPSASALPASAALLAALPEAS